MISLFFFFLVLTEPNRCFRSCSWHPSGTILAVGGTDSKVTILEYDQKIGAMTQIDILRSERDDEITSLAWNCLGNLLLCCTLNGSIHMILKSGVKCKMLCLMPGLTRMKNASMSCARWSWNMTNHFAVAGYTSIMLYEDRVKNKALQMDLVHTIDSSDKSYHEGGIANIVFSSDHKLVSAGADKTLKVWSLEKSRKRTSSGVETQTLQLSHQFVQSLNEHHTSVLSTDWSKSLEPHKSLIASGCDQKTLCIYRYHKEGEKERWGTVVKKPQAHRGAINHLAWHYMDYFLGNLPLLVLCQI